MTVVTTPVTDVSGLPALKPSSVLSRHAMPALARIRSAACPAVSLPAGDCPKAARGTSSDPAAARTKERLVGRTHLPPLTLNGPEPRVAMKRKMNEYRAASSPPLKIGQVAFGWCIVKYA